MRICGVLSWFDESPSWLATAVAGMARLCDQIVAVDGAYALYPGARARSHPDQAEAIIQAAEAAGAGCIVHRPQNIWWGNEVEKRNHCLRLAGVLLRPREDWVVIFDGDHHVLQLDADAVRARLEQSECDVATYTALDGQDLLSNERLAEFAASRQLDTEWTTRTRDIMRWDASLTYGPLHWSISRERDGEREWIRGPFLEADLLPREDLDALLVVYHRTQDRALVRRMAADHYYKLRDVTKIESTAQLEEEARRKLEAAAP